MEAKSLIPRIGSPVSHVSIDFAVVAGKYLVFNWEDGQNQQLKPLISSE
jgi:hypothetical protein